MSALPTHTQQFRLRRLANWLPMGFAYAFMYMGRYNLTVAKNALGDLMTKADFGTISTAGSWAYALAFLINGPLVDRRGGRFGMLFGVGGAIASNIAMGMVFYGIANWGWDLPIVPVLSVLYAVNMYFQAFGAVSIVTVKAPWFYVHERGTFSTIFGIIISAGIYFAFDWGSAVVAATRATPAGDLGIFASIFSTLFGLGESGRDENWMIFYIPAVMMTLFWLLMFVWLRNSPGEAGFDDFDTGEASLSDDGERLPVFQAVKMIFKHPVLRVVCIIEFCSGVLRNGIMHWYKIFGKETGVAQDFWVYQNWGLALLICGLVGANATGWVSDRFFNSRRAPMCGVLYALMIGGCLALYMGIDAHVWIGGAGALAIMMSVIAVHGILSGTATADFGGSKNTGIVVGIVDGLVYLGTGLQFVVIGAIAPTGEAAKVPSNWSNWPLFLIPFAIIGFMLTLKIWNSLPKSGKGGH